MAWKNNTGTNTKFYIRTERQNMIGFPGVNAFLFTIRTYFYDIDLLEPHEKFALAEALDNMSAATLACKRLTDKTELIKERLM